MSVEQFIALRTELGFNQTTLSRLMGVTRQSIVNIETGVNKYGVPNIYASFLCLYKERQQLHDWIVENHSEYKAKQILGLGVANVLGRKY